MPQHLGPDDPLRWGENGKIWGGNGENIDKWSDVYNFYFFQFLFAFSWISHTAVFPAGRAVQAGLLLRWRVTEAPVPRFYGPELDAILHRSCDTSRRGKWSVGLDGLGGVWWVVDGRQPEIVSSSCRILERRLRNRLKFSCRHYGAMRQDTTCMLHAPLSTCRQLKLEQHVSGPNGPRIEIHPISDAINICMCDPTTSREKGF